MAKFVKIFLFAALLLGVQLVAVQHVQAVDCGANLVATPQGLCLPAGSQSQGGVNDFLLVIINFLLSVCAIIAVLFIVWGGFRYITSNGSKEGAEAGQKIVTDAAIGLAIVILAYVIVTVVVNTVGSLGGGGSGASSGTTSSSGTSIGIGIHF